MHLRGHRLHLVIALALVFSSFVVFVSGRAGQDTATSNDAEIRAFVDRYFAAHTEGDLTAYVALWSKQAPELSGRTQALERILTENTYRFTPYRLSRLRLTDNRAKLWITTTRTLTRTRENRVLTTTRMALALELVREENSWRLWRETSAVAELASELVAARDEAEREALLSSDRDLLTRELLFLLGGQSDRYYTTGNYHRALVVNQLMLRVAEAIGSKPDQSTAWRNIGNVYYLTKDFQAAISAYQKSLALLDDSQRKFELAGLWTSLGMAYRALGDEAAGIDALQKSLGFSRELGDQSGMASGLESIAGVYRDQGRFSESAATYQQSLTLRENLKDRGAVANTLVYLAELEYEQGEDDRALGYYLKALGILSRLGRATNLAHTLHNVANLYYLQGNYDLALTYYQKEREEADSSSNLQGAAASLAGIGLIHSLYGDYSSSLDAYRRCVVIWKQLDKTEEVAGALQSTGRVLLAQGDFSRALEQFLQALGLREGLKDQAEIAWALLDVGATLAVLRDFPAAVSSDQRSLKIFEELADKAGIGAALVHLAGIHFVQEDYTKTIDLAGRAAAVAREANDAEVFWQARHRGGRAFFRLKRLADARHAFLEAIESLESQRPGAGERRPQRVLDDKLAPYLAMVDLAITEHHSAEAFAFSERARARTLKQMLQTSRVRITRTMSATDLSTEQRLLKELAVLSSQINRERQRAAPRPARTMELNERATKAQAELDVFQERLYRKRPDLKFLRGEGTALTAQQAGQLLSPPAGALLAFVETDEDVHLLVFTRTRGATARPRLQVYSLGVTRKDLAELVVRFQYLVASRQASWETLARRLYEVLFSPAEEALGGKTHLLIVPDGWLWNLPFAALQNSEGKFLIERYSLALAPSLTALRWMRVRPRTRPVATQLVAFGNPLLGANAIERLRVARRVEKFEQSHGTEQEVTQLGELYGSKTSRIYTGREVRAERIQIEASVSQVLHLAVPSAISEASPFFSQIALSSDPDDATTDGVIQLRDLMGWDVKAGLVILSESENVPRGNSVGRGATGFSWALLVAGCRSAVISQWNVDAPEKVELIQGFHRVLRSRVSPAQAWHQAVKQTLNKSLPLHPYYWAGFVLIGDVF